MDIKMGVTGIEEVYVALRHEAERVADSARKTMHRATDRIVREAQLNAPVDKHNLEKSIRKEKVSEGNERLALNVTMGGYVNGVNVDAYAVEVHENYDDARPGPETQAKRDANPGRHVGRKFLERAVAEELPKLEKALISATVRNITL